MSTREARRSEVPEWAILRPILRNFLPILIVGSLAAGTTAYLVREDTRVFPARSKLLVRFGYEYSPPPTSAGSDNMQVEFDPDEAIGTEVQILSSVALLSKTLDQVPQPKPADAREDWQPVNAEDVLREIRLERIEGTNVLLLELVDQNGEWARAFLDAHIVNYFADRERLFSNRNYREFLAQEHRDSHAALAEIEAKIDIIQTRSAAALQTWRQAISLLLRNQRWQEEANNLLQDYSVLRMRVGSNPDLVSLAELFSDFDAGSSTTTTGQGLLQPAVTPPSTPIAPEDILRLRQSLDDLEVYVTNFDPLQRDRERELEAIRRTDSAILRQDIRDVAARSVEWITPPYLSTRPVGLSPVRKVIAAGVLGLLASMAIVVIAAGTRKIDTAKNKPARTKQTTPTAAQQDPPNQEVFTIWSRNSG